MLFGVLRKKIWSDLFGSGNTSRTIQAVLSIAIGALAVGAILGALEFINADLSKGWQAANPPSITMKAKPEVSEELITSLGKIEGVEDVEGTLTKPISWRRSPDVPWEPATLKARADYEEMIYFWLRLEGGAWPEGNVMAIGRGFDVRAGQQVYLDIANKVRVVDIRGLIYATDVPPAAFGGDAVFYTTRRRFGELTGTDEFKLINGGVPEYTESKAQILAAEIEDRLEKQNHEVSPGGAEGDKIVDPNEHRFQDTINGIFLILLLMGAASLILGLLLVFNTITAIVSQQIPQIGILKAIGASQGQILLIYYTIVMVYGLLGLIVSIPLAGFAAHQIRIFMVGFFDMDIGPFSFSSNVILAQAVICLLSPLLIATIPIFNGANITVREAISSYGLSGGGGLLDRLLAKLTFLSRMVSMAISNTFRNKLRVFMVQLTLVGAGIMFVAVLSSQTSVAYTFGDVLFSIYSNTDVLLEFEDEQRISRATDLSLAHPAVTAVELWSATNITIRPAGQAESFNDQDGSLTALPIPSTAYTPQVRAGRWLTEGDTFAIVMHQKLAEEVGVGVGEWVTLDIALQRETEWQVVGLIFEPGATNTVKVPLDIYMTELGQAGRAEIIRLQTITHDEESTLEYAALLSEYYNSRGLDLMVTAENTLYQTSNRVISAFNTIITLLLFMAVVIAIVGGISLSGTLSINVLERRREIGVLRAIGASNNAIGTLFVTEGLILGWLSWLIVVPASRSISPLLTQAISSAIGREIIFDYSEPSIIYWFVIITVLAVAASWGPAQGAIKVSIRESLSYE
jgi:putative ABC transport system permease protein